MSLSTPQRAKPKTADEVRREFAEHGISVTKWALARGLSPALVYEVLRGQRKCVRGESRRAAIELGLKAGVVTRPEDFDPRRPPVAQAA